MSVTSDRLILGFRRMLDRAGTQISVKYYLNNIGSGTGSIYDEPSIPGLVQSGNTLWTSGILFTLDPKSSSDGLLMEQGKIGIGDIKLFLNGSLALSPNTGSVLQVKVGIGSLSNQSGTSFYALIPLGADAEQVSGVEVYKKGYFRRLTNGSLVGE